MDLLQSVPDAEMEAQPRTVTLELYPDAAELLDRLTRRTGLDASELVGWALGAYSRELEGISLEPFDEENVDEMVREGLEDIAAGRTVSQDEMFERLKAKYGG